MNNIHKMVVIEGVSESGKKEFQLSDGEVGERTYSIDFESITDLESAIQNLISLEGERCKVCDNILQECECKKKGGKL